MVDRTVNIILKARDEVSRSVRQANEALAKFQRETKSIRASTQDAGASFGRLGAAVKQLQAQVGAASFGAAVAREVNKAETALNGFVAAQRQLLPEVGRLANASKRQAAEVGRLRQASSELIAQYAAERARLQQLGRSKRNVAQETRNLSARVRESIQAIKLAEAEQDRLGLAAKRAASSLGEANTRIRSSATELGKVERVAKDAANAYQQAGQTIRREFLRAFQDQNQVVERVRASYRSLSQQATQMGRAIASVGPNTQQQVLQFEKLRTQARRAREELTGQVQTLQQMRGVLRSSGSDLDSLANAQARFTSAAARGQSSLAKYREDLRRAADAAQRLAAAQAKTAASTRRQAAAFQTTAAQTSRAVNSTRFLADAYRQLQQRFGAVLNLLGRVRDRLALLVATYIGFFGIVRTFQRVVEVFSTVEQATNRLLAAFDGIDSRVEQELDRLRRTAGRLGLEFGSLAQQYSALQIAAQGTVLQGEALSRLFRQVTEAARVQNLSLDQVNGIFVALSQIISKGTVSMEELRQQLGDRLPGAVNIFATALGISTEELFKLVEQGQIGAENLTLFGDALEARFGSELERSLNSVAAAIGRVGDSGFQAFQRLGSGGLIDSLQALFEDFADTLISEDFGVLLDNIGAAMAGLSNIARALVNNFDRLTATITGLIGIAIAPFFVAIVRHLAVLPAAVGAANAQFRALQAQMGTMGALSAALSVNFTRLHTALLALSSAPIALAFGGIGAALGFMITRADDATRALEGNRSILDVARDALDRYGTSVVEVQEYIRDNLAGDEIQQSLTETTEALSDATSDAQGIVSVLRAGLRQASIGVQDIVLENAFNNIDDLIETLANGEITLEEFRRRLEEIAQTADSDAVTGFNTDLRAAIPDLVEAAEGVDALSLAFADTSDVMALFGTNADEAAAAIERLNSQQTEAEVQARSSIRRAQGQVEAARALTRELKALEETRQRQLEDQTTPDADIDATDEAIRVLTEASVKQLNTAREALEKVLGELGDNEFQEILAASLSADIAAVNNLIANLEDDGRQSLANFYQRQARTYRRIVDGLNRDLTRQLSSGALDALDGDIIRDRDQATQDYINSLRSELKILEQLEVQGADTAARIAEINRIVEAQGEGNALFDFSAAQTSAVGFQNALTEALNSVRAAFAGGDTFGLVGLQNEIAGARTGLETLLEDINRLIAELGNRATPEMLAFRDSIAELLSTGSGDQFRGAAFEGIQDRIDELNALQQQINAGLGDAFLSGDTVGFAEGAEESRRLGEEIKRLIALQAGYAEITGELTAAQRLQLVVNEQLVTQIGDRIPGATRAAIQASTQRITALFEERDAIIARYGALLDQGVTPQDPQAEAIEAEIEEANQRIRAQTEEIRKTVEDIGALTPELQSYLKELESVDANLREESQVAILGQLETLVNSLSSQRRGLQRAAQDLADSGNTAQLPEVESNLAATEKQIEELDADVALLIDSWGDLGPEASRAAIALRLALISATKPQPGESQTQILLDDFNELQRVAKALAGALEDAVSRGDNAEAARLRTELRGVTEQADEAAGKFLEYTGQLQTITPEVRTLQIEVSKLREELELLGAQSDFGGLQQRFRQFETSIGGILDRVRTGLGRGDALNLDDIFGEFGDARQGVRELLSSMDELIRFLGTDATPEMLAFRDTLRETLRLPAGEQFNAAVRTGLDSRIQDVQRLQEQTKAARDAAFARNEDVRANELTEELRSQGDELVRLTSLRKTYENAITRQTAAQRIESLANDALLNQNKVFQADYSNAIRAAQERTKALEAETDALIDLYGAIIRQGDLPTATEPLSVLNTIQFNDSQIDLQIQGIRTSIGQLGTLTPEIIKFIDELRVLRLTVRDESQAAIIAELQALVDDAVAQRDGLRTIADEFRAQNNTTGLRDTQAEITILDNRLAFLQPSIEQTIGLLGRLGPEAKQAAIGIRVALIDAFKPPQEKSQVEILSEELKELEQLARELGKALTNAVGDDLEVARLGAELDQVTAALDEVGGKLDDYVNGIQDATPALRTMQLQVADLRKEMESLGAVSEFEGVQSQIEGFQTATGAILEGVRAGLASGANLNLDALSEEFSNAREAMQGLLTDLNRLVDDLGANAAPELLAFRDKVADALSSTDADLFNAAVGDGIQVRIDRLASLVENAEKRLTEALVSDDDAAAQALTDQIGALDAELKSLIETRRRYTSSITRHTVAESLQRAANDELIAQVGQAIPNAFDRATQQLKPLAEQLGEALERASEAGDYDEIERLRTELDLVKGALDQVGGSLEDYISGIQDATPALRIMQLEVIALRKELETLGATAELGGVQSRIEGFQTATGAILEGVREGLAGGANIDLDALAEEFSNAREAMQGLLTDLNRLVNELGANAGPELLAFRDKVADALSSTDADLFNAAVGEGIQGRIDQLSALVRSAEQGLTAAVLADDPAAAQAFIQQIGALEDELKGLITTSRSYTGVITQQTVAEKLQVAANDQLIAQVGQAVPEALRRATQESERRTAALHQERDALLAQYEAQIEQGALPTDQSASAVAEAIADQDEQIREELRKIQDTIRAIGTLTPELRAYLLQLEDLEANLTDQSDAAILGVLEAQVRSLSRQRRELQTLIKEFNRVGNEQGATQAGALLANVDQALADLKPSINETIAGMGELEGAALQVAIAIQLALIEAFRPPPAARAGRSQIDILSEEFRNLEQLAKTVGGALQEASRRGDTAAVAELRAEYERVSAEADEAARKIDDYANSLTNVTPEVRRLQLEVAQLRMELQTVGVEGELAGLQERIGDLQDLRGLIGSAQRLPGELLGGQSELDAVDQQIQKLVARALELVAALDQTDPAVQALKLRLEETSPVIRDMNTIFRTTADEITETLAGSINDGLSLFVKGVVEGQNAVQALADGFRTFAANFLQRIADMIIEQLAFNAAASILRGFGVSSGDLLSFHSGGNVPGDGAPFRRNFLAGDEYLSVLQSGETVLTEQDQRNLANRAAPGGSGDVTVINAIDALSFAEEALSTRRGQRMVLNAIQNNKSATKTILGV